MPETLGMASRSRFPLTRTLAGLASPSSPMASPASSGALPMDSAGSPSASVAGSSSCPSCLRASSPTMAAHVGPGSLAGLIGSAAQPESRWSPCLVASS